MKVSDVVNMAKARIPVLLTEDSVIDALLVKAMTTYQDLAGCMKSVQIESPVAGGFEPPADFLSMGIVKGATGNFVATREVYGDQFQTLYQFDFDPVYPLEFTYYANLLFYSKMPDANIPDRVASLLTDYLECLICMDNDDRIARAEVQAKVDTSRIPTRIDRQSQLDALIVRMEASRNAPSSMFSIHY